MVYLNNKLKQLEILEDWTRPKNLNISHFLYFTQYNYI